MHLLALTLAAAVAVAEPPSITPARVAGDTGALAVLYAVVRVIAPLIRGRQRAKAKEHATRAHVEESAADATAKVRVAEVQAQGELDRAELSVTDRLLARIDTLERKVDDCEREKLEAKALVARFEAAGAEFTRRVGELTAQNTKLSARCEALLDELHALRRQLS